MTLVRRNKGLVQGVTVKMENQGTNWRESVRLRQTLHGQVGGRKAVRVTNRLAANPQANCLCKLESHPDQGTQLEQQSLGKVSALICPSIYTAL